MANIIGVKFRSRGRLVPCEAGEISLQVNDYVVVDTDHVPEVAKVVTLEAPSQPGEQLRKVVRKAEAKDLQEARQNLEKEALSKCHEMVVELGLKMKPLAARYDFEAERLTVFFSAEERVDFRDLVRKLSQALERRVELRQVGARDEAKLLGCMGRCGYPLCCQNFLTSFASVSIKMAKEQSLALNPMKISGICGRLLCCLAYESKEYAAMKKKMPQLKQEISTPWGRARVIGTDLFKETVTVELLDNEVVKEIALDELVQPEDKSRKEADQT
ncbi:MAG TPA: regulatory iron-sulfur-containing complex subunit RicT [Dehalococcoidia bacterium]|nr:regulatory iron-sulfur-containing complex subunit RicT [Dehalococcoidia bacterium]